MMNIITYSQANPENTVGVLTMAGKGVQVLVTPTSDLGKILACMHGQFIFIECLCHSHTLLKHMHCFK